MLKTGCDLLNLIHTIVLIIKALIVEAMVARSTFRSTLHYFSKCQTLSSESCWQVPKDSILGREPPSLRVRTLSLGPNLVLWLFSQHHDEAVHFYDPVILAILTPQK